MQLYIEKFLKHYIHFLKTIVNHKIVGKHLPNVAKFQTFLTIDTLFCKYYYFFKII